ncbi:MAG: DUF1552 domain-containing protein [Myxococcota bacterium]
MLIRSTPVSRRALLASLGGAAAATALAPFVPRVEANDGAIPKRYVYWYQGTATPANFIDPLFPGEGPVNFKDEFSILNDIADDLLVLKGLDNKAAVQGNIGGPHPKGGATVFVGHKLIKDLAPLVFRNSSRGDAGFGNGVDSVDQFLAKELAGQTPLSDLRVGLGNTVGKDGDVDRSVSISDGEVVPRYQNPLKVYDEIFRPIIESQGDGAEQAQQQLERRRSVIDFAYSNVEKLRGRVSHFDQQKIDKHLQALRDTEKQLEGLLGVENCNPSPEAPDDSTRDDIALPLYSQLIAQALSCDLTRIAGGHFGRHIDGRNFGFLEGSNNDGWHKATHDANKGSNAQFLRSGLRFRAEMFVTLVQALAAVDETDGTRLLDHTIVFWTADCARNHDHKDAFTLLAGGTERFAHNKVAKINGSTNDILTSICHYMGSELDKFGDPYLGGGVLPGSVFT